MLAKGGTAIAQESRAITAEELFRMPDDGYKYELVAGRLRKMTPAGSLHGAVGIRLSIAIGNHVDRYGLGVLFAADTGFKLATNPDTVRAPDIAFVSRAHIPSGGIPRTYWPGAPDLAVEVLSPTDVRSEIDEKIEEYLACGAGRSGSSSPAARDQSSTARETGSPERK
jgi:Uma2 family endonuclease